MPAGHPRKQSRNTVGLRNAAKQAPNSCPPLAKVTQNNEEASDERWRIGTCFDSVRPIVGDESDSDTDADIEECQNGETWKMKTSRSIWWIWQEHKEIIQWMRIGCLQSCSKRDENCKRIRNVRVVSSPI